MTMKSLAEPAIRAVQKGDIKIIPASSEKVYYHWMENMNDWCLSRQLWFGHQCPAYFVRVGDEAIDRADGSRWVAGRTDGEARCKAEAKFPGKQVALERDPDVLDPWFSAGLWPFSTLGWPKDTHDMQKLFPTSVFETGWGILFFWVARMIFFSIYLTGTVPLRRCTATRLFAVQRVERCPNRLAMSSIQSTSWTVSHCRRCTQNCTLGT
ncbi:hypothetical protein HBH68_223650 [Parastagonospora nodorum]|nr:hypothetical protein HBH96_232180 [Parastagonospora nodorum]KAH5169068.1 hypothetical protein HBH68_223650 [Parastagonospora nodorum]KAH5341233.1 hypothetical protein HBI48_234690 [Parastagonospora nodorum]KAH5485944.1 hypothetical protein HBI29_226330 [Parastagonospora nodorum]KAH5758537.1 hypothetical protein HBI16_200890 [Parastagonospora nodorum]